MRTALFLLPRIQAENRFVRFFKTQLLYFSQAYLRLTLRNSANSLEKDGIARLGSTTTGDILLVENAYPSFEKTMI